MLTWLYDNLINTLGFVVASMSLVIAVFLYLVYLIIIDHNE
ncbi:MAG: hypothetical protein AB1815_12595 [Bacillota bacterium]|jgi:hypothetical protein